MGLDLHIKDYESANSKIGSYSGFGAFRKKWANHLDFDLTEMRGFGGGKEWTDEPIQCFFNHSDCDGYLSVKNCEEILKQAKKDYPKLKKDDQCSYSFPILIEFCEQAIKKGKRVEFR